ncbi:hypothetical protein JKP88DRAFT_288134 [Tribonema minus]|uniref:Uncharacterized protein n=1 Tax=Tribonema minus TaxID=303371 RepID=A0A835Z4M6_9STRA|nr:hypothetical protein JKP88DRAFT_288134 [Tribonema minus]
MSGYHARGAVDRLPLAAVGAAPGLCGARPRKEVDHALLLVGAAEALPACDRTSLWDGCPVQCGRHKGDDAGGGSSRQEVFASFLHATNDPDITVLEWWTHRRGCLVDSLESLRALAAHAAACAGAVCNGHFQAAWFLHEHGCPFDACAAAAAGGSTQLLAWLRKVVAASARRRRRRAKQTCVAQAATPPSCWRGTAQGERRRLA